MSEDLWDQKAHIIFHIQCGHCLRWDLSLSPTLSSSVVYLKVCYLIIQQHPKYIFHTSLNHNIYTTSENAGRAQPRIEVTSCTKHSHLEKAWCCQSFYIIIWFFLIINLNLFTFIDSSKYFYFLFSNMVCLNKYDFDNYIGCKFTM